MNFGMILEFVGSTFSQRRRPGAGLVFEKRPAQLLDLVKQLNFKLLLN